MSMGANGMRKLGVSSKLEHQMVQDHQFLGTKPQLIKPMAKKEFFVSNFLIDQLFVYFFRKPKGRDWTENGGPWYWGKMHHHCFDGGVSGGGWQGLLASFTG